VIPRRGGESISEKKTEEGGGRIGPETARQKNGVAKKGELRLYGEQEVLSSIQGNEIRDGISAKSTNSSQKAINWAKLKEGIVTREERDRDSA